MCLEMAEDPDELYFAGLLLRNVDFSRLRFNLRSFICDSYGIIRGILNCDVSEYDKICVVISIGTKSRYLVYQEGFQYM